MPTPHRHGLATRRGAVAAACLLLAVAGLRAAGRPAALAAAEAPPGPVTIAWAGDTVLGSQAFGFPPDGGRRSLAAVAPLLRRADVAWVNLEQALATVGASKCGPTSTRCYAFAAPPSYARILSAAGIDLANQANNHALDRGPAGRAQTSAALRAAHVGETGAPGQITLRTVHGTRVAFLGFAPYPWASRLDDIPAAARLVRRAAALADVVAVAIHAGAEGAAATHVPRGGETFLGENRGDSRAFAHAVIDAGADLVVGSGPHVVRGVEWYRGRLIAYSLGNLAGWHTFAGGGTLSLSGIVQVTLAPDGSVRAGAWRSLLLDGAGLPHADPSAASLQLVGTLSREDFGSAAARFAADGSLQVRAR